MAQDDCLVTDDDEQLSSGNEHSQYTSVMQGISC